MNSQQLREVLWIWDNYRKVTSEKEQVKWATKLQNWLRGNPQFASIFEKDKIVQAIIAPTEGRE